MITVGGSREGSVLSRGNEMETPSQITADGFGPHWGHIISSFPNCSSLAYENQILRSTFATTNFGEFGKAEYRLEIIVDHEANGVSDAVYALM